MEEKYTMLHIDAHNFQNTKDSLKELLDKNKEEIELSKVPFKGGLFNLFNHNVTGEELNNLISQLQNYIISSNNIHKGFIEEIIQIYNAFEYLDKDYIAAIIATIKSIEEVSKKEQQDRKDIKNIIYQLEQSVRVLKKFKEDINKLNHINDIDKLWEITKNNSNTLDSHSNKLEDVKNNNENLKKSIQDLQKFKEDINKLNHINDIDKLWEITENNGNTLDSHSDKFSDLYKQIDICYKKIKIFYFIVAGSLSITAVHFILNILGVI
ncbi:hypothetical protein WESB_0247 [Brachyspira pilosicoli WesB]|uniref:Uncharacterized protein n=1 Tax=Brachyspira pilosicoli WesB TaxID=1161918 RepID=K0JG55_BRAPL|nr:hypothetical protein [Brachyspira pilosicoli]CCG55719.1 hypothetical protein WESB_0247 [Brachyspira pilosicoli WesB]